MEQSQKFSVVLPAEIQKSESGDWRVFGLASTPKRDLQGEVIDLRGLDLTPIQKGKGIFNWDHKEGPENTIGAIDTYKKADDGLYLGGYLFKEHDRAKSIYQIMSSLKKSDKGRIGMSVEGIIRKRSGDDGKTISKATITKCALTMSPVNTDTYADLVKSLSTGEVEFDADALNDDGSFDSTTLEKAGEGTRGGKIIGHTKSGKPIYASNSGAHAGEMHPQFSAKDHEEARTHLSGRAGDHVMGKRTGVPGAKESYDYYNEQAGHHVVAKYDKHLKQQSEEKPTTEHVPVTHHSSDNTGSKTFAVEHKDGSKKLFHAEEGSHESVRKEAEEYRKRNMNKSLGIGAEAATTLPGQLSGGAALGKEDLEHKKPHCEKCTKSDSECSCAKEMKKGDADFYKSLICELMDQLKELYPQAGQTELWEAVKDRLDRKFPSLNGRG